MEQCLGVIRGKNATMSTCHTWVEVRLCSALNQEVVVLTLGLLIFFPFLNLFFFFLLTFLRLIQDVQTFIENLGQDCAANIIIEK